MLTEGPELCVLLMVKQEVNRGAVLQNLCDNRDTWIISQADAVLIYVKTNGVALLSRF